MQVVNPRSVAVALLTVLLVLSTIYLVWALPDWLPILIVLPFAISLAMVVRRRAIGYSFGLLGLVVSLVFAIGYVIGDYEEATLRYVALPRHAWLAIVCAVFLSLAWVLKCAQKQH